MALVRFYARRCDRCNDIGPITFDSKRAFRLTKQAGWVRVDVPLPTSSGDADPIYRREDRCPGCKTGDPK